MSRKEELGAELAQRHSEWEKLKVSGGSDFFGTDGANMNIVRNQVIALKKKCEDELDGDYPPEYYVATPEEVDKNYVARSREIKKRAKKSLEIYEQNTDYLWLREQIGGMSAEQIKETGIQNVIDFPAALRFFIEKDMFVDMRRHENPERYTSKFRHCREKVVSVLARPSSGRKKRAGKAPSEEKTNSKGRDGAKAKMPEQPKTSEIVRPEKDTALVTTEAKGKRGRKKTAPEPKKTVIKESSLPVDKKAAPGTADASKGKKSPNRKKKKQIPDGQMTIADYEKLLSMADFGIM